MVISPVAVAQPPKGARPGSGSGTSPAPSPAPTPARPSSPDTPAPPTGSRPPGGGTSRPPGGGQSDPGDGGPGSAPSAGSADPPAQRPDPAPAYTLDALSRLALDRNPKLAQAVLAVEAARGRAVQAGLAPNPFVQFTADELGDRTGPRGILGLPYAAQEIPTHGKLRLGRAAGDKEADQLAVTVAAQRLTTLAGVRAAYVDVLAVRLRTDRLRAAVADAAKDVDRANDLVKAKKFGRTGLLSLEAAEAQLRAELAGAEAEAGPAFVRLAAAVGAPDLPPGPLAGSLDDPLPEYDLGALLGRALAAHPEVAAALVGVDKARLDHRKAIADGKPNVTVYLGYTYQDQNKSNDWATGVGFPVPVWNRNQGNVRAAAAGVGDAAREVDRVRADLADRAGTAFREYDAARARAAKYKADVLPRFQAATEAALEGFKRGEVDLPDLAQVEGDARAAGQEYVKALADAWRAAAALSGLAGEDVWPPPPKADDRGYDPSYKE